ncbi:hypothetical protein GRF29_213g1219701 [Pseudopithomyces chartarum]|uniref:3'-5' exonuclease domain-containing protein n=1 Tax=Pseudopithomyces chartarum TaxID=1892770 RepID=A0AAN6LRX6_9PLEO|nr:hypothetical protein GRF29_213g1219701 [Pseudopithomyces chartarum]
MFHTLVNEQSSVSSLVEVLQTLPENCPYLYVDLEGIRLSRYGSVSIITIYVQPMDSVYLVDVYKLQTSAFTTPAADGTTLKSILESPTIIKVFFDLRNDSDALYHHFGVRLNGVEDVQLMENAGRPAFQRRYVNGLDKCITKDAPISHTEKQTWKSAKEKGLALFHPTKGGTYEVFDERPLKEDIERYCIIDVQFLPALRNLYWGRLDSTWKKKVIEETTKRVLSSQKADYEPHSNNKKFGPWEGPSY